jgi:plasmid stability protein
MATLHVRGVPDDLYRDLTLRAKERDSSITAEAIRLLRKAIALERPGQAALMDEIFDLRARRREGGPSPEELIREDRER